MITPSEAWLNCNISDNDIKLENYVLFRAARGSRGGGVATSVSSNLVAEVQPTSCERLFVQIIFPQNKCITVGNVYRPPSAPVESSKYLMSTFESVSSKDETLILGDFNENWLDKSPARDKNNFGNLHLAQLIHEPTGIAPKSQSLLDWILVTHPERFVEAGILSDCLSDHSVIYCMWKITIAK